MSYRDALSELTEDQLQQYQGKVLAIHEESGDIIAAADTLENLRTAVRSSVYKGPWRRVDGPTGERPLTVEEQEQQADTEAPTASVKTPMWHESQEL